MNEAKYIGKRGKSIQKRLTHMARSIKDAYTKNRIKN